MTDPLPPSARVEELLARGNAHARLGRYLDALDCFERARILEPVDPRPHRGLGSVLVKLRQWPEALVTYQEVRRLAPGDAWAHHELGWIYDQLGRPEEALDCYRQSISLNPAAAASFNNMANVQHALGRFAAAHAAYRHAIHINPSNVAFQLNFVQSARLALDDPCVVAMQDLLRSTPGLPSGQLVLLHFALAQVQSDNGRDDTAFAHLLDGNALKRQDMCYDETATLQQLEQIRAAQGADLFRNRLQDGNPADAPIFIVGMPRSGTTLVEQILASHPDVFGAGESDAFRLALSASARRRRSDADARPVDLWLELTASERAAMGSDYLRRLRNTAPQAGRHRRITDKHPFNFMHLGSIHLAFPNARIVHVRRSPVETCLSAFSKLFQDVPFSYDLGELGRYYRAYDTLMAHWRQALPPGVMLEIEYETLVQDLEPQVLRLLDHCGLHWNAHCLSFHLTERAVGTASAAQVRRPLYTSSLKRWRPAREVLAPLLEGLGPGLA